MTTSDYITVPENNVLVQCAISDRGENIRSNFVINVHADVIIVKSITTNITVSRCLTTAKRGTITEFSRRSRKRLLERLAMARNIGYGGFFITLTYPGEFRFLPDEVAIHNANFRKALIRKYPNVGVFWRKELKPRLSGASVGEIVPHFHLLAFNADPRSLLYIRRWVRLTWSRIIAIPDTPRRLVRTQVDPITTRKHAMRYCSKYAAKVEQIEVDDDDFLTGRHWGYYGTLDFNPAFVFTVNQEQLIDFKRLLRAWLKSKKRTYHKRLARIREDFGYSVFGLGDLSQDLPPPLNDLTVIRMVFALN